MQNSLLTPLHERAGARLRQKGSSFEVLTYGDVPGEYRAGTEGCLLFDETDRGRLRVTGGERADFLHRLLANRVRELKPGEGNRNLLLSAKGKVRHDFDVAVDEDELRLSVQPGQEAALLAALDMYHFTEDVQLAAAGEDYAPITAMGPRAAELLERTLGVSDLGELPDHAWRRVEHAGAPVEVTALVVAGSRGFRIATSPAALPALWSELIAGGAQPAGVVVRDILRCEAGYAEPGVDITDEVYPQEARLESAFHLEKGCYIGQEVVAKIDTYQGLNKRLVALCVSHDDPVAQGTRLFRSDEEGGAWRDLGVVTSWAYSFVLDAGLVLAYVKRRHQGVGTRFRLGDGPAEATIVALPVRADAVAVTGDFE